MIDGLHDVRQVGQRGVALDRAVGRRRWQIADGLAHASGKLVETTQVDIGVEVRVADPRQLERRAVEFDAALRLRHELGERLQQRVARGRRQRQPETRLVSLIFLHTSHPLRCQRTSRYTDALPRRTPSTSAGPLERTALANSSTLPIIVRLTLTTTSPARSPE